MAIESSFLTERVLILILIILQIATPFFSFKIGKILGKSEFWKLMNIAFIVIIGRRIIDLIFLFNIIGKNALITAIDRTYIPLIFWVCLGLGMYTLHQKIKRKEKR
jgi:hypothetical protein